MYDDDYYELEEFGSHFEGEGENEPEKNVTSDESDAGTTEFYAGDLPYIETLQSMYDENPPLFPVIISGLLRRGNKMLIAGGSKVGKTWALIDLVISVASGSEWMGMKCDKGKVLYINMELDRPACNDRFKRVLKSKLKSDESILDAVKNISVWNLRGFISPLSDMIDDILAHCEGKDFTLIVVDPIYKVLSGDENNATEMTKFTNFFDKITKKLDVATVYAHHHSKGDQTKKVAMDRMSGSGVFARDPDAVLDFTSIETLEINRRALKMEYAALRGFPIQEPRYVWFEFPEFYEDADGIRSAIAAYKQEKKREAERLDENEKQRNKEQREKDLWEDRLSKLDDAFEKLEDEAGKVECKLMAENLDISVKTLYAWAERFDFYECSKGKNAQIWRNYV